MNRSHRARVIKALMARLIVLVQREGGASWLDGIEAMMRVLEDADVDRGLCAAREIYFTMIQGGGGFSEFYFVRDDPKMQAVANAELDQIRDALWRAFQEMESGE